jgi:TonB family protein
MQYLLKVALCWLVFYLLYRLVLEKTTFFRLNRAYLLITLLLGLVLPLVRISLGAPANNTGNGNNWLPEVVIQANTLLNQPFSLPLVTIQTPHSTDWSIWPWVYWAGVGYCLSRFGLGLFQLRGIYRRGEKQTKGKYILVYSSEVKAPFSFWRYLFWPTEFKDAELERSYMLRHEETHILQHHTLDVLFSELTKAICWFNPLAYHYSLALRDVHEYLADAAVLQTANRKQYGHLLIRQSLSGLSIALVNHFSTSQLKKRIHMMMRKKTQNRAQLRYFLALPLLAALGCLFAHIQIEAQVPTTQNSTLPPPPPVELLPSPMNKAKIVEEAAYSSISKELVVVGYTKRDSIPGEVFKVVETMPEFPGGMSEMIQFLAKNIRYPEAAKKENIEGMVVVQFIIGKDGSILDPHIVKGIGGGANEEAVRVVGMMPKWKPGQQRGQVVNVQYNLPIRFALEGTAKTNQAEAPKEVFHVVEEMPKFPGGSDKLLTYLADNINYPKLAKDKGIEGMVVVQYIVEKDGSISNAQIMKGIGAGCDEEALRVVKEMPKWTPGLQRGQETRVQFNLPIRFKLDERKVLEINATSLKVEDFKATPNPSKGLFNLSFRAEGKATNIEVYNLAGQRVYHQVLNNFDGQYNGQIDLSKQPTGEYFIRITQGGAQYNQKVLKQ